MFFVTIAVKSSVFTFRDRIFAQTTHVVYTSLHFLSLQQVNKKNSKNKTLKIARSSVIIRLFRVRMNEPKLSRD